MITSSIEIESGSFYLEGNKLQLCLNKKAYTILNDKNNPSGQNASNIFYPVIDIVFDKLFNPWNTSQYEVDNLWKKAIMTAKNDKPIEVLNLHTRKTLRWLNPSLTEIPSRIVSKYKIDTSLHANIKELDPKHQFINYWNADKEHENFHNDLHAYVLTIHRTING